MSLPGIEPTRIQIDTHAPGYHAMLVRLGQLREYTAPLIEAHRLATPTDRRWWLERDPLLRDVIELAGELRDVE